MRYFTRLVVVFCIALAGILSVPEAASAYGGPGSIVSGIGAFLAVVAAFVAAVFGFFWFPLKRVVRKLRGRTDAEEGPAAVTRTEEMAPE